MSTEALWLKRWNQDISGAEEGLSVLKKSLDGAEGDYGLQLEIQLLESSILRAKGENKLSSSLLGKIYKNHAKQSKENSFYLSFELGLDYWCSEDVAGALNHFLEAEASAPNNIAKIFALSNLLWCLDHLALPQGDIVQKLKFELEDCKIEIPALKHVRQQFLTYSLRKDFYAGKDISVYSHVGEVFAGQASYLYAWCNELPYLKSSSSVDLSRLLHGHYLWQSEYRLGTLQGAITLKDQSVLRIDDGVYRLYLWIWRWINGDERANIEKILYVFEALLNILELDKLSKENSLLLRNSLGWLFLLNPKVVKKMSGIYQKLRRVNKVQEYIVLEDEFSFIQYMNSSSFLRNDRDYEGHEYFKTMALKFRNLHVEKNNCAVLTDYVLDSRRTISADEIFSVIVDLSKHQIKTINENQVIHSALLTHFFSLIVKNEVIGVSELGEDFIGDKRRLYNLCARVKNICPELELTIKDNKIYRESSARTILILHENRNEAFKNVEYIEAAKSTNVPVNIQAARFIFKDGFVRNDFQEAFNISKATACRFISALEAQGALKKQGLGRNVFYQWSQNA